MTGIHLGDKSLQVAKLHVPESGKVAVDALAEERPARYDAVTCVKSILTLFPSRYFFLSWHASPQ
ncbi:MAG: hypothetical protein Q8O64_17795 [Sideroxyarcus sp.]|nr:hypothetical protein [Sideroxyarcus sp.]